MGGRARGTLNISVEGMLLAGVRSRPGKPLGILGRCRRGPRGLRRRARRGVAQANLSHRLTANQFVVGLALNVLVLGLTAYLDTVVDLRARGAGLADPRPRRAAPRRRGAVRPAVAGYLVYALVPALWWLVYRTRWGLERAPSVSDRRQPTCRASTSTPAAAKPSTCAG